MKTIHAGSGQHEGGHSLGLEVDKSMAACVLLRSRVPSFPGREQGEVCGAFSGVMRRLCYITRAVLESQSFCGH